MIPELLFVGIDVSKTRFDVFVYPAGKRWSTGSSPTQIGALASRLLGLGPVVVGLEASGGYERRLADSLHAAGLKVHILPPARVRNFAKAMGQLAKTDMIDAAVIARYLATVHAHLTPYEPNPVRSRLSALAAHRRRLVAEKSGLTSQLDTIEEPLVRDMLEVRLRIIDTDIA
ncbi:transposase, partial [Agrobacterium sp. MAFF210268]